MTDSELLAKIKNGLGITGTYQDDTLNVYIAEVKAFMLSAGISQLVITDTVSVGCIMRGVADLWNYGSGNTSLSEYFTQRMLQLKFYCGLTITQATGTTVSVTRNGTTLSSGAILSKGNEIKITVTGGTVKVNGETCTSGDTYTVNTDITIVSESEE